MLNRDHREARRSATTTTTTTASVQMTGGGLNKSHGESVVDAADRDWTSTVDVSHTILLRGVAASNEDATHEAGLSSPGEN
jgi:hypothetical protein